MSDEWKYDWAGKKEKNKNKREILEYILFIGHPEDKG